MVHRPRIRPARARIASAALAVALAVPAAQAGSHDPALALPLEAARALDPPTLERWFVFSAELRRSTAALAEETKGRAPEAVPAPPREDAEEPAEDDADDDAGDGREAAPARGTEDGDDRPTSGSGEPGGGRDAFAAACGRAGLSPVRCFGLHTLVSEFMRPVLEARQAEASAREIEELEMQGQPVPPHLRGRAAGPSEAAARKEFTRRYGARAAALLARNEKRLAAALEGSSFAGPGSSR